MYKVFFEDDSIFIGGAVENSHWNKMSDIPIKKIEYTLGNKTIILENYEAYNHIVERTAFIQTGRQVISKLILMTKQGNEVIKTIYDFIKCNFYPKLGLWGKEYNNKPTSGWKIGIKGKEGKIKII